MTPQRARTLAGRWFLAGLALIPVVLILNTGALAYLNGPIAFFGGIVCGTQVAHWLGWARGFEAAQKAQQAQASADPLIDHLRCYIAVDVPDDVAVQALRHARAVHEHVAAPLIVKQAAQIIRTHSQPYQERPGQ